MNTLRSTWIGLLAIAVGVPAIFWLRFQRVDGFAFGLAGFLVLLGACAAWLPSLAEQAALEGPPPEVRRSPFDWLGVVWLLAIPFAPFAMWLVGSLYVIDATNWQLVLGIKTAICIVLPVVCMLPLVRYVRGKNAPWAVLVLAGGTLFPILVGQASAADLMRGPQWESVTITSIRQYSYSQMGRHVTTPTLDVELADHRTYEANIDHVTIKEGKEDLLILKNLGLIIGARAATSVTD